MSDLCVVLGGGDYPRPFKEFGFDVVCTNKFAPELADASLVVFTGGEDVDPALYGVEDVHPATRFSKYRDLQDVAAFKAWSNTPTKFAGICRGSQFLYAIRGGQLIQDIGGHANGSDHLIKVVDGPRRGQRFTVSSTHHQCWSNAHSPANFSLLAVGPNNVPEAGILGNRTLLVQFHPEYMAGDSACFNYYQELLTWFMAQEA
jgi:gamma-glutamyl-gamma-aminobutyrate hydrolase PuuD